MSGHSKWATTKYRKGAQDQARAKSFAKLIRLVEVAAREGGSDMTANAALRTNYQKARDASVPLDTIERAIKRGSGELEGVRYEAVNYEGYAPGGVAVIVETLTDNRNRTGAEVRNLFSRNGGSMAEPGAVSWQFERKGVLTVPRDTDEDRIMEVAMEAGAEDLTDGGEQWSLTCAPTDLGSVRDALEAAGIHPASAELTLEPTTTVEVADEGEAKRILRMLDAIDDHDDVQSVHANYDIADEVLAAYEGCNSTRFDGSTAPAGGATTVERVFVLGIDPGLSRCGYGVVTRRTGRSGSLAAVSAGVIETDPLAPLPERLLIVQTELRALMGEVRPDAVAVERVFFQVNARTAMSVGQASGLALAAAAETGCEVVQYTANEVKQALVGYGSASKDQVQQMVARVLDLDQPPSPPDVADALALAICHLTTMPLRRAVERAAAVAPGGGRGTSSGLGSGAGLRAALVANGSSQVQALRAREALQTQQVNGREHGR